MPTEPTCGPALSTSTPLPDTPAWSKSRLLTIHSATIFGMLMVVAGALGNMWGMAEPVATLLVNNGASLVIASMAIHIGGASAERIGGWFTTHGKDTQ